MPLIQCRFTWEDNDRGPGIKPCLTLQWRHNGRDDVSNHQPHDCLLNRLFRRRSKKTSKHRVTGLCAGNSPVNSPHKWPVTRKMFPFDDVIMESKLIMLMNHIIDTQGVRLFFTDPGNHNSNYVKHIKNIIRPCLLIPKTSSVRKQDLLMQLQLIETKRGVTPTMRA